MFKVSKFLSICQLLLISVNCFYSPKSFSQSSAILKKDSAYYIIFGILIGGANSDLTLDVLGVGKNIKPLYIETANSDGKFLFEGYISKPELMQIRLPAGVVHVIVMPGDSISLRMVLEKPGEWEVNGSIESKQLIKMYMILENANDRKDSTDTKLKGKHKKIPDSKKAIWDSTYAKINFEKRIDLEHFITETDTSFCSILACLYLAPEENLKMMQCVEKKFRNIYPDSPFYKELVKRIEEFNGKVK